jgi:hypothetical protein
MRPQTAQPGHEHAWSQLLSRSSLRLSVQASEG